MKTKTVKFLIFMFISIVHPSSQEGKDLRKITIHYSLKGQNCDRYDDEFKRITYLNDSVFIDSQFILFNSLKRDGSYGPDTTVIIDTFKIVKEQI